MANPNWGIGLISALAGLCFLWLCAEEICVLLAYRRALGKSGRLAARAGRRRGWQALAAQTLIRRGDRII